MKGTLEHTRVRKGLPGSFSWTRYWAGLISATVEQAAPTKIVMTFSQANTSLLATDFTIAGKTITLLERDVTNKILTLTVSVAVVYGASHTITFVKTGGTKAVTNNIIYAPVIDDGNTKIFFDSAIGITKDGSNLVSAWNSRIGANHLLQATGTNQPLWSASGVLFDGIDNFMKCVGFTWVQPEFLYLVVRQKTWTQGDYFFDGNVNNSGALFQYLANPGIQSYAGAYSGENPNLAINTWGIVRVLFNGASSKLIVNNTTPVTGNPGTANMGGLTLGAISDGSIKFSNTEVKEIIGRSSVLGEAEIYAYYATKYAAILP